MNQALLVSGVIGVGKSTVAAAIGGVLSRAGLVTAVVDVDQLAQYGPPPSSQERRHGFYDRLKCANLAAVWANFRSTGACFAVVSAGIESVELRASYASALEGCDVRQVRLVAPAGVVQSRLRVRDSDAALERHLSSLAAQEERLVAAAVEDFTVVNDGPCAEVALEVVARVGWLPPGSAGTG